MFLETWYPVCDSQQIFVIGVLLNIATNKGQGNIGKIQSRIEFLCAIAFYFVKHCSRRDLSTRI